MDISNVNEHSLGTVNQNEVEKPADKSGGFSGFSVGLSKNDSDDRSVRDALTKSLETHGKTLFNRSVTMTESPAMKETKPADDFVVIEGDMPNILPEGDSSKISVPKNTGALGDDFETMDFNEDEYKESRKIPEKYYREGDPVGEEDMCAYIRSRNIPPHKSGVLASIGRILQSIGLFF